MVRFKSLLTRSIPRPVKRLVNRFVYRGSAQYCPICESGLRTFRKWGVPPRASALCPMCNSLERHRFVWRYLQDETPFLRSHGKKMLHWAPEEWFRDRFRQIIGPGYVTADLLKPADVNTDITDTPFPDESFDIIYCSHVLEHVPDDRKAMQEMRRVLKQDGWAIFMVPITVEKTIEDPTISDPQERLRLFGQEDHVRRYGPDFVDRLRDAGFTVRVTAAADFLSVDEICRIAVGHQMTGEVFHCTRATARVPAS
jgi:hypothetical protein